MPLSITFQPYTLYFKKKAGTSRGVMTERKSYFLKITDSALPGKFGWGECGVLPGLSFDDVPDYELQLQSVCELFNQYELEVFPFNLQIILNQLVPEHLPSIRFGIETALLDIMNGGLHKIYENPFSNGVEGVLMNGLIWMGTYESMIMQVEEKLRQGFTTIKLKVGAIDFEKECKVLESIRKRFLKEQITLRVDANGAFETSEVYEKLKKLATYDLHSIEQPIRAGQTEMMYQVCKRSPIPVALDEELIGVFDYRKKYDLLKKVKPAFIILKPSLLGGFQQTSDWIEIAGRLGIGWWITSALESNIGLNAIAQFTAKYNNPLPQGLGTGQLYINNIDSPLVVRGGHLYYDNKLPWGEI